MMSFAILLSQTGQWKEATSVYHNALSKAIFGDAPNLDVQFDPQFPMPSQLQAMAHIAIGLEYAGHTDNSVAFTEFDKAIRLVSDSDLANYYYGYGWQHLDPKDKVRIINAPGQSGLAESVEDRQSGHEESGGKSIERRRVDDMDQNARPQKRPGVFLCQICKTMAKSGILIRFFLLVFTHELFASFAFCLGGCMSHEPETPNIETPNTEELDNELVPIEPIHDIAAGVARIEAAPTLAEKGRILREMPPEARHQTLGVLPAPVVAALIEGDPEHNTALIANLPAEKYRQVINLGTPAQGRAWLERAIGSGTLAGTILPSLMTASDLADMLVTEPSVRRALPRLLNFERAERWRQLLTTNEWHKNIDELLMSDTDELLNKAQIRNKSVKAVLHSLLDYVPELYLEVVNLARDRAARMDEHENELEDLLTMPFGLPELQGEDVMAEGANRGVRDADAPISPLADLIPEGGDPMFALATAGLSPARKAVLEEQLKTLLRDEIVATASFATADMQRAAGRVLFYLRAGLESFGPTLGDATHALETRPLSEISAIGARLAESYRQKALSLSGLRDWLDGRQRQFLDAMKMPEAGVDLETREPVLYLAGRPKQDRSEWHPTPLEEIQTRLADIAAWGPLARAAFGTADRMHAIYAAFKTRTWDEALRRTVLALVLYRRWEPELVRPVEDYAAFRRQYGTGKKNGLDEARQIVLDALDSTPDAAWKPSDAKARARELLLRAVGELETMPLPGAVPTGRRGGQP